MRQKRGQFYLIAALIIIAVIIGFAGISNYIQKKEVIKLYDLGEELGIESQNVLDFGTYNEYNQEQMQDLLEDFIASYAEYIEEGIDISFIFGNYEEITIITYQELAVNPTTETFEPFPGGRVTVIINGTNYSFRLRPGENFYFVISQEIEGEQYVVTG